MPDLVAQWKVLLAEFFATDGKTEFSKEYANEIVEEVGARENMRYNSTLEYFGGVVYYVSSNNTMAQLQLVLKELNFRKRFPGELHIRLKRNELEINYYPFTLFRLIERYSEVQRRHRMVAERYKWELVKKNSDLWQLYLKKEIDFPTYFKQINWSNLVYFTSLTVWKSILATYPTELEKAWFDFVEGEDDLQTRIDTFKAANLDLLKEIKDTGNSDGQQERAYATVLCFCHPELYTLFMDSFYTPLCYGLGIKPAESGKKLVHFYQLVTLIQNQLTLKYKNIIAAKNEYISGAQYYHDTNNLLLVQDICYMTLMKPGANEGQGEKTDSEFHQVVDALDPNIYAYFMDTLREMVQEFGIQSANLNVAFTVRNNDQQRLGFIVNNLLVFSAKVLKDSSVIMAIYDKPEGDFEVFESRPNEAWLNTSYSVSDVQTRLAGIKNMIKKELSRNHKSGFVRHNNAEFINELYSGIIMQKKELPLNQILFGPPGTGKTYASIEKALKIVDPNFYEVNWRNRSALKERFNELIIRDWEQAGGQIAFCTFHQSFSYEDFIEGIKPKTKNGIVSYDIENGIFKEISRLASDKSIDTLQMLSKLTLLTKEEIDKGRFYKLSLGEADNPDDKEIYEYCKDNGFISIGFGEGMDLTGLSESQIKERYQQQWPGGNGASMLNYFIHKMTIGDYVVISKGNHYLRAFGRITGDYEFDDSTPIRYTHFRKVEWLFVDKEIPVNQFYNKQFSQASIYSLKKSEINMDFFKEEKELKKPIDETKFVLIIDEINRGNVSQIFGELITLIEPDKRKGRKEEIRVLLPYSKEEFGVPSNLYIVGTMNTADRSVEALDSALRRRFSFEETPSLSSLLYPTAILNGLWHEHVDLDWTNHKWTQIESEFLTFFNATITNREAYEELEGHMFQREIIQDIDNVIEYNDPLRLDYMLEKMNSRIEKLLDKDHQIGHAYFMSIYSLDALKRTFRDKIIPLLQEYFFGDYGKIGLVLGQSFVERIGEKIEFANFNDYEGDKEDYETRPIYKIREDSSWDFRSIYK